MSPGAGGRASFAPLAAVLLIALAAAASLPASGAAGALTNEDIVRMVMTGVEEKDILDAIEARDAAFDLRRDIVAELKTAGVGETILDAMRRRQARMPAPAPTPSPTPPPGSLGWIEVVFEEAPAGTAPAERSAVAVHALPPRLEHAPGIEVGEATDMALAVLCLTADHVPDHWETRSPLDRAPRHELLLFRPGSAQAKEKGFTLLYLVPESAYRVQVPEGNHEVQVAAAARQAGSGEWRIAAMDGARVAVLAGATTRLTLRARSRIAGSYMKGFRFESDWSIVALRHPGDAADTPLPPKPGGRS